jgi:hypothetical protein
MKLSKKRSTKRSYRKASPKKRVSHRKRASPKKRVSHRKKPSYRKKVSQSKRASPGTRHRVSFRFGDSIDSEHVTMASVLRDQELLNARLKHIRDSLADDHRRLEILNNDINSIRLKYFTGYLGRYINERQGNDAVDFVCGKLNITPQRLFRLIPSISELDADKVTIGKIKLLMMAYAIQEMNNYVDTLEPHAPDRVLFRFGDSIDAEYVTVVTVSNGQKSLQARLVRIREHLDDNPGKREIVNGVINSIKDKYFAGDLNRILNRDVRGNDAFEFVCEKLNIKPQRLLSLIPSISELDPDKVTVDKIRLLMMAYAIQEMNNYVDTLEPPDVWRRGE